MITRKIQDELAQCAAEYPAVTILGPRQSGKTTLAKMAFPKRPYLSLEDPDIRRQATTDPRGLLRHAQDGAILDEIQRAPELLSYLQGMIDEDRKPGRFILTGSHQPLVHQAISQSLAGRTAVLELLPFTVGEVRRYKKHPDTAFEWILQGFYPGLHENKLNPTRFFRSYMATYIERDLRQLIQVKDLSQFETFLRLLAGRVGQLVNYASLAGDVGVSATTIKHWLSILKASYILFELPPWFANIRKRLVKSPKLYFTDVALAAWLLGMETPQQVERDPLRGVLYENLLIMEVVKAILNQGKEPTLYFFRDGKGNEVDLLITTAGRSFTAVEIKSATTFQPEFVKGIEVFRDSVGKSARVDSLVWYNGLRKTTYHETAVSNPLQHGFSIPE
ncbi:MAG: ATP-binding protein [Phycisphaerae bacterium]|nr:ATP-binding protein [Phycisphaerae bacterium]